jgi:alcohol dehydrogenase class IV
MGVPESFIDETIAKAMKDHCHATNPRIATREEYRQMIRQSW